MAAEDAGRGGTAVARSLPLLTPLVEPFWTGGRDGKLRIHRCEDCGFWVHPPEPVCPSCLGRRVSPQPVSGRAELLTFTVNHQPWHPDLEVPYVIAIVELAGAPGVRLTTNIVNCPIAEVRIGMAVQVVFEQFEDVFLPLFEPAGA
jgi:uncharacterized OB-fold protein